MVAVVDLFGKPLMPTNEYRARKLLKRKKAKIFCYRPFTIQLTERKDTEIQPIELCMDTGYIHIGISAKSERHEYLGMQIDTLTDEKLKHDDKRQYRRQRRNRKRYRAPRFDNRRRKEGWITPSLEHKKEIHIDAIQRICKVMPITDITLEMGNFDTQVLKAVEEGKPLLQGSDYQHGERYGIATLREAVFLRDGYKCQCCEKTVKDGAILHVHHIKYRSQGGTNRMSNLITVCDKCHTPQNHKPGGKLWNWKPKLAEFKGASYMTSIRWMLYNEVTALLPNRSIHITYGAKTKESRRELDIEKSHVNDAYVMGLFHPKHRTQPVYFKKKRRNNRVLERFYDAWKDFTMQSILTAGMERNDQVRNCLMAGSAEIIRKILKTYTCIESRKSQKESAAFVTSTIQYSHMIFYYVKRKSMRLLDVIALAHEQSCCLKRNQWHSSS